MNRRQFSPIWDGAAQAAIATVRGFCGDDPAAIAMVLKSAVNRINRRARDAARPRRAREDKRATP